MLYKFFLVFCLYLPFQIALNPTEGIDLASARLFVVILTLWWLIFSLKNRQLFISQNLQTWLLLSFLFISALSLFWAENLNWGLRKLTFLLSMFPLYFVTVGILKNESGSLFGRREKNQETLLAGKNTNTCKLPTGPVVQIIKFLVWGAALAAAVGLIQFFLQFFVGIETVSLFWREKITLLFLGREFAQAVVEHPSWLVNVADKDYLRAFGLFPDPHMFSLYLGLALPLAGGLYFELRKREVSFQNQKGENWRLGKEKKQCSERNLYLVLALIILAANLLTFSRGGYLGLAAGFFFILWRLVLSGKFLNKTKLFFSVVLTIALFLLLATTPVGKRFVATFSLEEGSNKERLENWAQALRVIEKYPQGTGIGNYAYEIKPAADYRDPIYAHNLYLDVAAETGIISSAIFLFLIVLSVKAFVKKQKQSYLYLGQAVSLVIFATHSFFETALYSVQVLPLFLILVAFSALD